MVFMVDINGVKKVESSVQTENDHLTYPAVVDVLRFVGISK